MAPVIVFGPTGNVGAWVARTAREHGAQVILAMRDNKKLIRKLDESQGGYERVQADLTQPDSVTKAVKATGAKRAFIYLVHGTQDHMKASIEALKAGGIEFVVFLSSFTVQGDLKAIKAQDMISFMHASVELVLETVFGKENFVALRPGGFATNLRRYRSEIQKGKVGCYPKAYAQDCITPDSMGKVGGAILVDGPKDGDHAVYLFGPEIISFTDTIDIIAKVLGKPIEKVTIDREEAVQQQINAGVPPPLAERLIQYCDDAAGFDTAKHLFGRGVENVQRYTGQPSLGFEEWVSENKDLFE